MKTPWHLWFVGILSLLFNAGGAFDYFMTHSRNAAYMEQFTPEQLAFFYGFPTWVIAAWAIAVWFAVLGSVLLLARRRLAVLVFGVSLFALLVTTIQNFGLSQVKMQDVTGTGAIIFSLVIVIVATGLLLYARWMAKSGVLR